MKKLFFLAIGMLALATTVNAQYYYHPRPHRHETTYNNNFRPTFYIVGGVNIANIVSGHYDQFQSDNKVGAFAGAGFDLPVTYPLSITIEGLYSQKGYTAVTSTGDIKQRTDYIDVPLLAKIHVVPGFNLLFGPQASFLLDTHNYTNNGVVQTQSQTYNNTTNGYDKTLIGAVGGISFDLGHNIELRGRYTYDLSRNNENGEDTNVPPYRNQVWQVGLGIKF